MKKRNETIKTYIKITLHLFNALSLLVGIFLTLIGLFFASLVKYENNYVGFYLRFFPASILLIGVILMGLFILGLVVLFRENNLGVAIFTVGLMFISLLLLALGIWSFQISKSEKFAAKMYNEVNISMSHYDESNSEMNYTVQVDLLQTKFKCCGLNSYKEWKSNLALNKNSVLKNEYLLNPDQIPFDLPDSCCVKPTIKCGKGYVSIKTVNRDGCYFIFRDYLIARIRLISIVSNGFAILIIPTIIYLMYSGFTTSGNYYFSDLPNSDKISLSS